MEELSTAQKILIEDLKDDIEFYKEELESQIKLSRTYSIVGIGLAVVVGIVFMLYPELLESLKGLWEHMGTVTGFVGEIIPVTFASKSFNIVKVQKNKLKGMRIFIKTVNRIENGILPNSEQDITAVESDLALYINT